MTGPFVTRRHRRPGAAWLAAALGGALSIVAIGCSAKANHTTTPTLGSQTTLAGSKGFTCHDPKGDISLDTATNVKGTRSDPSGIDILLASTNVTSSELEVKFQTAGPITNAAKPLFDLVAGDLSTAPAQSFELRALPAGSQGAAGQWAVTLYTFENGQRTTELSVPVVVQGDSLSYSVPLNQLPPIVTLQWQFGTSSEQPDGTTPFDDCNSFTATSSTTTPTT